LVCFAIQNTLSSHWLYETNPMWLVIHGVKPTSASQFNQPGHFSPAGPAIGGFNYLPRQVEFGLRLSF
jgi:hypothetical protein